MQINEAIDAFDVARQRSDLTFKHNADNARHGWLRLTPAYSVKMVEALLQGKSGCLSVFDPFSGTATTPLCAAYHGHEAASADINPFLVWFGQTKLRHYGQSVISDTREKARAIQSALDAGCARPCSPPHIANVERWWDASRLEFLCSVKGEIDRYSYRYPESKDLLSVAFCRAVIDLSNAAFNHQSMSFKDSTGEDKQMRLWSESRREHLSFAPYVDAVLESAVHNPAGRGHVFECDARKLDELSAKEFDIIITSPPYPNRMSYIRELRPYMYWLGYLQKAREAGEMDCEAIGGTWGIATSRLNGWRRDESTFFPGYLEGILKEIARSDGKSGELLSKYVGKYFEDMWRHFVAVRAVVRAGGELHYIIGNSKFYDCLVPAERIYGEMLRRAGFGNITIRTLRKRNSKKELFEYEVAAEN